MFDLISFFHDKSAFIPRHRRNFRIFKTKGLSANRNTRFSQKVPKKTTASTFLSPLLFFYYAAAWMVHSSITIPLSALFSTIAIIVESFPWPESLFYQHCPDSHYFHSLHTARPRTIVAPTSRELTGVWSRFRSWCMLLAMPCRINSLSFQPFLLWWQLLS